jgi:hypothetical protein
MHTIPPRPPRPRKPKKQPRKRTILEFRAYDDTTLDKIIEKVPEGVKFSDVRVELESNAWDEPTVEFYCMTDGNDGAYRQRLAFYRERLAEYRKWEKVYGHLEAENKAEEDRRIAEERLQELEAEREKLKDWLGKQ